MKTNNPKGNLSDTNESVALHAKMSETDHLIEDLLSGESSVREDVAKLRQYDKQKMWKAIQYSANIKYKRRVLRKAIAISSAACLFFALGFTLLFMQHYQNKETFYFDNHLSSLFEPGSKRATLEMSDGKQIELSEMDREIVEQDNTKIMVTDGLTKLVAAGSEADRTAPLYNTIRVERGSEYSIVLEDGSTAFLNSESSITYPTRFTGKERKVSITGEVFIDVAKNPERPFIVEVQDQLIRVLGTSFNISAYEEDEVIVTTVLTGVVLIDCNGRQTTLPSGMQSTKAKNSNNVSVKSVDAESYAAWTKGSFVFFDESMDNICKKFSRWYNIKFDTSSPSIKNIRYSGVIKRYATFNEMAELIKTTQEIVFIEQNGIIKVLHNPTKI